MVVKMSLLREARDEDRIAMGIVAVMRSGPVCDHSVAAQAVMVGTMATDPVVSAVAVPGWKPMNWSGTCVDEPVDESMSRNT